MKTKFLLPVLAILFATGMSFTTVNLTADPNYDYISTPNGVESIPEMDCGSGGEHCRVQLVPGGTEYQVFDDEELNIEKESSNPNAFRLY